MDGYIILNTVKSSFVNTPVSAKVNTTVSMGIRKLQFCLAFLTLPGHLLNLERSN